MNILNKIFRKIIKRTPKDKAYIQLTPLSLKVNEDYKNSTEKRRSEVAKEIEKEFQAFSKWTGYNKGDDGWFMDLVNGYTTVFALYSTYEPEGKEFDENDDAAFLLDEIYSAVIMGDQGTYLEGQSFKKRARWVLNHK